MYMGIYKTKEITDISPEFLHTHNISLLLLDLDNTIGSYTDKTPSQEVKIWAQSMHDNNIHLYIVTNNKNKDRVENFAKEIGASYRTDCHKPLISKLNSLVYENGYWNYRDKIALVGDQVFTDVIAGVRSEFLTILVKPLKLENPLHIVRYILEFPFRIGKPLEETD